jgi:antitoxin component of RelBE/YafQ-DinJ toxin-antitoxin module
MERTARKVRALAEELCRELGLPLDRAGRIVALFVEEVKEGQALPLDGDLFPTMGSGYFKPRLSLDEF